jgi:hypothetical protein
MIWKVEAISTMGKGKGASVNAATVMSEAGVNKGEGRMSVKG